MLRRPGIELLFFDIPNSTKAENKIYRDFMKTVKKAGYVMLQESVYVKLITNVSNHRKEVKKIKSVSPEEGSVIMLPLSMGEFSKAEALSGESFDIEWFAKETLYI